MPQTIIELLEKAARANAHDNFRHANMIVLPDEGTVVVAGDLHGHRRNFERIVTYAALHSRPNRHLVLQEIIHGGPEDAKGGCLSYKLLFEAARLKLSYPDQVHFILANHDTASISDTPVMKDGREMNRAIREALQREFEQAGSNIKEAISQLLFSQPLAVRTQTRIWVSHSLPDDRNVNCFDAGIFDRPLQSEDITKPGSAYLLTWGRNHRQETLDKMAGLLDVDLFVLGHQPQPFGWSQAGENLIIIASDHNHGCLVEFDLAKKYRIAELADCIVPLASIA